MIVGGYTLDLYCDIELPLSYIQDYESVPAGTHRFSEFPHGYFAETGAECRANARKKGWVFHRDGTVTCPRCAEARRQGVKQKVSASA